MLKPDIHATERSLQQDLDDIFATETAADLSAQHQAKATRFDAILQAFKADDYRADAEDLCALDVGLTRTIALPTLTRLAVTRKLLKVAIYLGYRRGKAEALSTALTPTDEATQQEETANG